MKKLSCVWVARVAIVAAAGMAGVGCLSLAPGDDSDDGGEDKATRACIKKHNAWLLDKYAPGTCVDGPSCIGRASLDSRPTCEGAADYSIWSFVWDKHLYYPMMARRNQARNEFMMGNSPHYLDRDRFIEKTAATPEEIAAHEALLAIPWSAELFDYKQWVDRYDTLLTDVASPLYSQASLDFIGHGREICGSPFDLEASDLNCDHEPTLFLNRSEQQLLSMFEEIMPSVQADGAFAHWMEFYYQFVSRGLTIENGIGFVFPAFTGEGLAAYELDFFQRLRSFRPSAEGIWDSEFWMHRYILILSVSDFAQPDEVLRVDLLEATKPPTLVGLPAYELWLGSNDMFGDGFSTLSGNAAKLARLKLTKPCARDQAELAQFAQVFAGFTPAHPGAPISLAAPVTCAVAP